MKTDKYRNFLIVLFLTIVSFQSCNKDDVIVTQDAATNTETDTIDNAPKEPDADADETPGNDASTEGEEGAITQYRVDGDNLIKETDYKVTGKELEFQKDTKKHQEIWELTKKIIPPNYRSKMSEFIIFAGEKDGTAGYVYSTNQELSKWAMGIAIDFAYLGGFNADGELAYTIVHEFGHILTLNDTQIDHAITENSCKNYFPGEGCSKKESYINKLFSRYWSDIAKEHSDLSEDQDEQEKFYQKYQDRFVTGYASTNPGEDIAEVFATFVTRNGGPNGSSIAEQKIQLMYDHPEVIELRNYIRGNTARAKSRSFLPAAGAWKKAETFGNPKKINCTKHGK
ncbi:hypothetical protein [Maribacter sp. 2210JD10-5]|uniref:hypothetical protein n=1 Tax=Maribacter sp. 2210JD10-5 TaxID=3386272 RepID=UPI0039BC515B